MKPPSAGNRSGATADPCATQPGGRDSRSRRAARPRGCGARPNPPETEDQIFDPGRIRRERVLDDDEYLQLIDSVCHDSLEEAFGADLQRREWKYAVDAGQGECSLACVRAERIPSLEVDDRYGKLQLRFNDPEKPAYFIRTAVALSIATNIALPRKPRPTKWRTTSAAIRRRR